MVYPNVVLDSSLLPQSIIFFGAKLSDPGINVTVAITGLLVTTTLIVELLPCEHHPGNVYNVTTMGCVCFQSDIISCKDHNENKRLLVW